MFHFHIKKIDLNFKCKLALPEKQLKDISKEKRYLYFGDTFIKSSKKLINIKGMHNKDNEIFTSKFFR